MEDDRPTINTTFWVVGDGLDLDVFTTEIGVQPTFVMKKGELSSHPTLQSLGKKNPATMWEINHKGLSYSMNESIQKILDLIWEKREHILDYLRDKPNVQVGVRSTPHIYEKGVDPEYALSVDTIHKLIYLRCEFSMDDVYDYRPPRPLPPQLEGWNDDNPFLTTSVWVGGAGFDLVEWEACVRDLAVVPQEMSQTVESLQDHGDTTGRSWHLVRTSRCYSTDEAVQEVLAPLWARREAIKTYFSQRPGVMGRVRCLVEIVEDRTVYELLLPTLQQLAFLGWAVCLDVHNYRQEDDDE